MRFRHKNMELKFQEESIARNMWSVVRFDVPGGEWVVWDELKNVQSSNVFSGTLMRVIILDLVFLHRLFSLSHKTAHFHPPFSPHHRSFMEFDDTFSFGSTLENKQNRQYFSTVHAPENLACSIFIHHIIYTWIASPHNNGHFELDLSHSVKNGHTKKYSHLESGEK